MAYHGGMASRMKDTHTPNRAIRIDDDLWAAYEAACAAQGTDRSAGIRRHMKRVVAAYRRQQATAQPS